MEAFFQIGVVTSTHGLNGEVKVYPTTDDPKRFKRLKEVILDSSWDGDLGVPGAAAKSLKLEQVKFFKQFVILKFEGVDSIEEAQKYRRASLLVARENAVRLGRDEYFIADLEGLEVRDEDGARLGVLKEVLQTGANDVYVIGLDTGKELLLPAIRQCVLEVNMEGGFVRIHILEGLEDL